MRKYIVKYKTAEEIEATNLEEARKKAWVELSIDSEDLISIEEIEE